MVRSLKLFAVLLVVTGTVVLAFQSGAFSQVTADRDVSGQVASSSNAYLAGTDVYGGQPVRNDEICIFWFCFPVDIARTAAQLENRYVEDYTTLDARVVSVQGAPANTFEVRAVPGQLAVGATGTVDLGCSGDVTASGTADVVLGFDAAGGSIDIDDARVTVAGVQYDCVQRN